MRAFVALAASGTTALASAILASAGRARSSRNLCLVPAYTFVGTISAIEQCGYKPYFLDIDLATWSLDPSRCRAHPLLDRVGLVVPVAPYGRPIPQDGWQTFIETTGIPVVIDGAAAFESLVRRPGDYVGPVPVAVSFHATKSFCTGEGGAVFSTDLDLWRDAIRCINFGCDLDRVCRLPGLNAKMSEYSAAVGLAELDDWPSKMSRFAAAASTYKSAFEGITARLHTAPTVASNYAILEAETAVEASSICARLAHHAIGHRRWYGAGAHQHPYTRRYGRDVTPVADDLARRLIGLPMSVDLRADEIEAVALAVTGAKRPVSYGVKGRSQAVQSAITRLTRSKTSPSVSAASANQQT